jgi:ubiquinone/menaquinone biosynthesis C-methylase UbiE
MISSFPVRILKYFRDARLVWDVMGSVYNRRIYGAVAELYTHIAGELDTAGRSSYILDAGAGSGFISLLLAARNPRAIIAGIDYSSSQVRAAESLREKRRIANCSFSRGNVMDIGFDDGVFDAAVSIGSIKHWPDAIRGLKEIHRVLKPEGIFIISETDQGASDDAVRRFIRRFGMRFIPDDLLFWGLRHVIFGQSYTEKTMTDILSEAGFRNAECQRVSTCPYIIVRSQK